MGTRRLHLRNQEGSGESGDWSGAVLLIADTGGKAAVAAGVTDDLTGRLSAVELVRAAVAEPLVFGTIQLRLTASAGHASLRHDGGGMPEPTLRAATTALQAAGAGQVRVLTLARVAYDT